ncbi:MAG: hypothetical protein FWG06_04770, partial [Clostridiales bacterium]|nr:hypothetical protein [Clostridiales bacterium]
LFAKPKGANATLLSQLVTQGAVNSAAAEPYFALFTEYTRLNRASYLAADRREIQVNMSLNMDAGAEGGIKMDHKGLLQMDFSGSGDTEYIEDILNGLKMSMTNQVAYFGGPAGLEHEMDFKLDISLRDGVCYINTDAGEAMGLPLPEKIQTGINLPGELIFSVPTTFFVEMVVFQTAEAANNRPPAAYYGIAQIKDIKIFDTENGGKRLDITYPLVSSNIVLQGMESFVFSSAMQLIYMITMGLDFTAGDITQSCFLDKNGVCTGLKLDMSLNETVFTGAGEELTVELSAQLEYHITDTGRGVKITPPPGKAEDYTELLDVLDDLYMAGLF